MCDRVPPAYRKLPGADEVRVVRTSTETTTRLSSSSAATSTGRALPGLEDQFIVNIDHHSTTALFGNVNWIDSTASAVGEMIYNLAQGDRRRDHDGDRECVYTALLTDTGSFHFSNTTERTFKIASELVRHGAQPAKLSQAIFYSYPYAKVKLAGAVLSTLGATSRGGSPGSPCRRRRWRTRARARTTRTGSSITR